MNEDHKRFTPAPGQLGKAVDRTVALIKTWPLDQQRSVDIRDPEYLRTIDTRILKEAPEYLQPLVQPVLEERRLAQRARIRAEVDSWPLYMQAVAKLPYHEGEEGGAR